MIYRTTVAFIFTLLLTQVARALPQACSDHTSPASKSVQHHLPNGGAPYTLASVQAPMIVTCDPKFDIPAGFMSTVACANPLEPEYPLFKNIPSFPFIGGAYDAEAGSDNCGACWKLTNADNDGYHIYLAAIDRAAFGFNIGVTGCDTLRGDGIVTKVNAEKVPASFCGFT